MQKRGTTDLAPPRFRQPFVNPSNGYVYYVTEGSPKLVHRLVMEAKLGRRLLPGETVHHLNGVKTDNRPANLELWSRWQPKGQRVDDLLAHAVEIIRTYGDAEFIGAQLLEQLKRGSRRDPSIRPPDQKWSVKNGWPQIPRRVRGHAITRRVRT